VFIGVTAMFFPRYTNFAKANIGYMPRSLNRLAATFKTAERAEWLGLLFPLYNYHDRCKDVRLRDFNPYAPDSGRGYAHL
jgi:hypothetical protein